MNRIQILALGVLLVAFGAAAQDKPAATPAAGSAPTGRFGFVNTERILRDAIPAQRAQKKIEAEFQKRDQEMARLADQLKRMQDDLEKNAVTMSESQRRTKEREFREDLNQRRNEELAQVVEAANRVIRQIAEQEKYDIILQDAVYASPRIDLTDKVIKALDSKSTAK